MAAPAGWLATSSREAQGHHPTGTMTGPRGAPLHRKGGPWLRATLLNLSRKRGLGQKSPLRSALGRSAPRQGARASFAKDAPARSRLERAIPHLAKVRVAHASQA